jgi:hypothetical protein
MPVPTPRSGTSDFHSIEKHCLECGAELVLKSDRDITRKKYCSRSCKGKYQTRELNTRPPRPTRKSYLKMGETMRRKMRKGLIPKPPRQTAESHRKQGLKIRGKNHPNWIEDRSKLKKKRFNCSERDRVESWRKDIFRKFDYICQKTNIRGGELQVHHIFNWADHPSKRYDPENGIVLSLESHKEFHEIYGVRNNTLEQLNEFLGAK